MSARDEILASIKTTLGPEPTRPRGTGVPRDYRVASDDAREAFLDRLAHYEAVTHVVAEAELDETVRATLNGRSIVVPAGIPDTWTHSLHALHDDPPLDHAALDQADGVLTTCALAIAQTGTIVLDGAPGMGRRALTLLPDYHLCVVRESQLVSSVPEAIRALRDNTRPLTFVSGPSATVDIEMTRVRGVHGPRRLEVIIAAEASSEPAT